MKKWLPWILVACFAVWIAGDARSPSLKNGYDITAFGRLPVLLNGRIQPFDSVARNTLLNVSGKSTVRVEGGKPMGATEWMLEAMTRPEQAATRKIFRAQHPDVESMLGTLNGRLEYYSFNDLTNHFEEIDTQARKIMKSEQEQQLEDPSKLRTPFQKDLLHLYQSLVMYHRIQNSLQPEGAINFQHELHVYREKIPAGLAALQASEKGEKYEEIDLQTLSAFFKRYDAVSKAAYPLIVPPLPQQSRDAWSNIGASLMESMRAPEVHPAVAHLAAIATGYSDKKPSEFNQAIADYRVWLQMNNLLPDLKKGREEFFFNQMDPFTKSMSIYIVALLIAFAYWMTLAPWVRKSAFALVLLAFGVHTLGLIFRMYLEGRPPVTNLYSSAIFVGWAAVLVGILLERIFRGGIGLVVACVIGFVTQIIAYHLAQSGDTMEMLRAVLDTNIWLATHVVCITIGYSAMFLAGLLAIVYILMGFFSTRLTRSFTEVEGSAGSGTTKSVGEPVGKVLARMVYGVVCFATLFSFVGTILGGIWADQSWGRFWGWDPKENGALLIVIWCAIWLHSRWGGVVKERGLMAMAVFGNIVTSFSWFGVNMLGVGLHSYGFMDQAFLWLVGFMATQAIIIALCFFPNQYWNSFKDAGGTRPKIDGKPGRAVEAGT
jgi:cytochrome c-type biogenesis protein CcsB